MTSTLPSRPAFLDLPTFLPRVTKHDGRAIEQALAGPTLFDRGVKLDGAIVEATFAADDPPLLRRLVSENVPQLVDPQTIRFCGGRFLQVEKLRTLPYAPTRPITSDGIAAKDLEELVRGALEFQSRAGGVCCLAPAVPYFDRDSAFWLQLNDRMLATHRP
jgi:hypothetical protein